MTVQQKKVYRQVLTKNHEALTRGKGKVSLLNIMMQLRKTCNHVELIQDQDQEEVGIKPEDKLKQLLSGSGKLMLLDKLLLRFRENGDRVLVFSQMVTMLNLLEDYMQLRRFLYQRLDGGLSADRRKVKGRDGGRPHTFSPTLERIEYWTDFFYEHVAIG